MHASPAWWDFSSVHDRVIIEQLINKLKRCGFLPAAAPDAAALARDADDHLFRVIADQNKSCESIFQIPTSPPST